MGGQDAQPGTVSPRPRSSGRPPRAPTPQAPPRSRSRSPPTGARADADERKASDKAQYVVFLAAVVLICAAVSLAPRGKRSLEDRKRDLVARINADDAALVREAERRKAELEEVDTTPPPAAPPVAVKRPPTPPAAPLPTISPTPKPPAPKPPSPKAAKVVHTSVPAPPTSDRPPKPSAPKQPSPKPPSPKAAKEAHTSVPAPPTSDRPPKPRPGPTKGEKLTSAEPTVGSGPTPEPKPHSLHPQDETTPEKKPAEASVPPKATKGRQSRQGRAKGQLTRKTCGPVDVPFPQAASKVPWSQPETTDWNFVLSGIAFPVGASVSGGKLGKEVWKVSGHRIKPLRVILTNPQDKTQVRLLWPGHIDSPWNPELPPALTAPSRDDGIGAQFHCVYASAVFAWTHNLPFCHTSIRTIGHGEHKKMQDWERFFGLLDKSFVSGCPFPQGTLSFRPDPLKAIANKTRGVMPVDLCGHGWIKTRHSTYYSKENVRRFQQMFWSTPKPDVWGPEREKRTMVAVHIRRGDSLFKTPDRIVPLWVYHEFLKKLRKMYPGAQFHLHSEGKEIEEFIADDVVLHSSETLMHTFTRHVTADVLVLSISQLSWIMAMLSECNEVFFPKLWQTNTALRHPPLPHWRPYGPDKLPDNFAGVGRKGRKRPADHTPAPS